MTDSSWNNYTPDAPRGRVGGMLWAALGVGALLLVLFGSLLAVGARFRKSNTWPIVKNVTTRLQTDKLAANLYRQNPDLATAYPTEQVFLDRVREFRKGLRVADDEPAAGPEYRVSSSPFDLRVRVRTDAETWMELGVEFGGPFRPAPAGEGIFRLNFAKDARDLRPQITAAAERRTAGEWARFTETCRILAQAGGPAILLRNNPGLRTLPAGPAELAALASRRQADLRAIPEDFKGPHRILARNGPFGRTVEIEVSFQDGGRVRAVWKQNRLAAVELH